MKLFLDRLITVIKQLSLTELLMQAIILLVLLASLVFLAKRFFVVDQQTLHKNGLINRLLAREKKSLYVSTAFLVLSFSSRSFSSTILHYYPEYTNPFAIIGGVLLACGILAFAIYLICLARRIDLEEILEKH